MLLLAWLAACAAEQLSVHISPSTTSAGSVQPICSGGSDCHQALTATFSLAMIALGEDFGAGALPAALVPFQLDPPIPGKLRWVTTTIARFDPDDDFPPSLNFALRLSGMASRSGATLPADARTEWHFSTPALRMSVARVHSPLALALTGGSWVSSVHSFTARTLTPTTTQPEPDPTPDPEPAPSSSLAPTPLRHRSRILDPNQVQPLEANAHEVPPDGRIELHFCSEVRWLGLGCGVGAGLGARLAPTLGLGLGLMVGLALG